MARGKRRSASPPGAFSQRTDLDAPAQPIRVPTGQAYGDRQASEQAQAAVPLPDFVGQSAPPTPQAAAAVPGLPVMDVFGPSAQPDVPIDVPRPKVLPDDPDQILRILYSIYPHPDIARLINPNAG